MHTIKIFPSLISGDLLNLGHQIEELELLCDGFHIDIMDFNFVPNLTWGAQFIRAISHKTTKPLHIHLMIERVIDFIKTLELRPSDILYFHIESKCDIFQAIKTIREKNTRCGIAINPKTALREIFPYYDHIDSLLLMSVEPGFSGQSFLKESVDRAIEMIAYNKNNNKKIRIGIDGGINATNIKTLALAGITEFSIASAIFDQPNPAAALKKLSAIVHAIERPLFS
jgi:ribulose-phosphate 3-epimerase